MRTSNTLREPDGWGGQSAGKPRAVVVFATLLGLVFCIVGFGFVAIGSPGGFKYALLIGLLFLLAAAYGFVTRVRRRHVESDLALATHDGAPAMEIRYSKWQFVVLVALVLCMAAIFALAAVDYALIASPVPAALCAVAAAFFLSFLLLVASGLIRRGRVLLSEEGIYQEGRAFTSFIPWHSFVGMKAVHNGLTAEVLVVASETAPWEKRQTGWFCKIDKLPPAPMIEIDTAVIDLDRTLIFHVVRYYLENASARSELGTAAGLERVRSGALD